ncbi:MAG: ComEC/Rec2 family competence protein [Planctomycetes bacterium]|nr:ComEC/Rec2 family competence protein [Planctomycetota bacterium]
MPISASFSEGSVHPPGSPLDASGGRRRRPLLFLALAFGAGIVLDAALQPAFSALGGWSLAAGIVCAALLALGPRRGISLFCAGLLASCAAGAMRHGLAVRIPPAADISRRTPETASLAWLQGTLVECAPLSGGRPGMRAVLELEALGPSPEALSLACGRVQLAWNTPDDPALAARSAEWGEGDAIRVLASLEAPHGGSLPAGFDPARDLGLQGIARVGTPALEKLEVVGAAAWWRVDLRLRRWGGVLAARNVEQLGAERAGLLNALVLGRREGLAFEDREAFQRSGAAHLLAISGLHVHFLAVLLMVLLPRLGVSRRRALIAAIACAFLYVALTGGRASAVRAAVMIGLYGGAWLGRRAADPLSILAAAALAILAADPVQLFAPGFQLSFLAVLGIVTLNPTFEAAWRAGWRRSPEPQTWTPEPEPGAFDIVRLRLRQGCFVSLAAWTATAPAVAWHLGAFNVLSVITNMLAVPLTAAAFVGGALATLLGGFGAWLTTLPLTVLLGFNRLVGELPFASFYVPPPGAGVCVACAALLAALWLERGRRATLPALGVLLPVMLLAVAFAGAFFDRPERPRLTVLDLPLGRAAWLETPGGEAALLDAGGPGDGRRIAEALRRQGVRALALLVVSADEPDALGGAAELLARMSVRRVVLPRSATPSLDLRALETELARRGIPYGPPDFETELRGPGDVEWRFITDAPDAGLPKAGSESLAVHLTLAGAPVLVASMHSEAALQRILARAPEGLRAEVVVLSPAPGGRWPASTAALLDRTGARVVVAARGNWSDADGAGLDLDALAMQRGLRLLRTSRDGTLRLGSESLAGWQAYRDGKWEPVAFP